jgi:hypothetical protein
MLKQIQHITLVFLVMTGFILMGTTCFQHTENNISHTILKPTSKNSVELVAELEEDETEHDAHLYFDVIPFLHFLYENSFSEPRQSKLCVQFDPLRIITKNSFQAKICVFRI